jgi:hypothetical protein
VEFVTMGHVFVILAGNDDCTKMKEEISEAWLFFYHAQDTQY